MASGQVAGVIEDLPSCAELVERVMAQAHAALDTAARALDPAPPAPASEKAR